MKDYLNSDLKRLLHPYAKRVQRQVWLRRFGICLCAGVGAGVALLALSFFVPIKDAAIAAAAVAAAICLIGGLLLVLVQQHPLKLAMEIDRHGFRERVQTLLALQDEDTPFARLQREETVRALHSANPKERIPVRLPRRPYGIAAAGVAVACVLALVPSPQDGILQERARIDQVLQDQLERVEESMDLLEKNNTLSEARKAELNDQLRELAQQLREGKDYKESIRRISQIQQQLGEAQNQQNQQDLNDLREALAGNARTAGLANRMENQQSGQAAQEIRQAVQQAMEQEDGGQSNRELAQALREAAQEVENEEWKQALQELADALESGDQDAIDAAMEALEDAMGDSQSDASRQISNQLQQAKGQISQSMLDKAGDGEISQFDGGDSSQGDQGDGQQGEGGQGQGQGQGQGSGSGRGPGSGQGGTGNGSGGQGGSGAGAGTGELVEAEKVYSGERLDGDGETLRLQGEMDTQGERQQMETGPGQGSLDGYIPYNDVAGEYADDAINAAKREELPPAVQNWVEGYFSALQND